jgi:dynein light chain LC8-type
MSEKIDAMSTSTDAGIGGAAGGTGPKAIIKNVDMSDEMQQESVDVASSALEKYNIEKDIAAHIKKEFDRRHGPTWHVVVGKNFGSYVTHGTCLSTDKFVCKTNPLSSFVPHRNQTFHLLLRRFSRHSHLEVIIHRWFPDKDEIGREKEGVSSGS